jgi:hypothetical protein
VARRRSSIRIRKGTRVAQRSTDIPVPQGLLGIGVGLQRARVQLVGRVVWEVGALDD